MFRGAQRICNEASAGCVVGLNGRMAMSPVVSEAEERAEVESEGFDDSAIDGLRGVRDVNVLHFSG